MFYVGTQWLNPTVSKMHLLLLYKPVLQSDLIHFMPNNPFCNKTLIHFMHKTDDEFKCFILYKLIAIFLFFKPFPASFFFIFAFSIKLTVKNCFIKICQWLNPNRGPLVSESTPLPTEPQPLPLSGIFYFKNTLLGTQIFSERFA